MVSSGNVLAGGKKWHQPGGCASIGGGCNSARMIEAAREVEARTSPSVDPNTKIKSSRKTSGLSGKRTTEEELQGVAGSAPPRAATSHQEMSCCRGQNISDQRPPEDDPAAGHVGPGAGVQDRGPSRTEGPSRIQVLTCTDV